MVCAARSKVRAVSKYAFPRREIWNVIRPSRGSLAADRKRFEANPPNRDHFPCELGSDRRTSQSKVASATNNVERDQTCYHRLRIGWAYRVSHSNWALLSPLCCTCRTEAEKLRIPCDFPKTKAKGTTKSSSPRSSLTCKTQSRQSVGAPSLGQGSHDFGRVITSLGEVAQHGAGAIDEYLLRVGAVETWVLFNGLQMERVATRSPRCLCVEDALGSGDVLKIWKHIQAVMRGNQIICAPRTLPLLSSSGAQPPHFVANRSLKALITESIAANTCAPSTRRAAACRSITDS